MTMPDLDPAHVEAVARAMIEVAYYDIAVEFMLTFLPTGDNRASVPPHWEGDALVKAEHYAKALMESTDPAVHAALLAAVAPLIEARVREARAEALTDAADAWTQGAWAGTPRHKDRVADRMAASQYAGDWLRERAEEVRRRNA